MPLATVDGISLCYETANLRAGDAQAPTLLLVMGLGTQMIAWPPSLIEGFGRS
ncbi:hypothetical protein BH23ACT9_BH23ACT9_37610 [soil metagenome]